MHRPTARGPSAPTPGWLRLTTVLLLLGCESSTLTSQRAADTCVRPGYTDLGKITLWPTYTLDLAFVLDNGPSMAPKRARLMQQLPKMLRALGDPADGTLPNLRLAILDGDLGSGGTIPTGACGPRNGSLFGDAGQLQAIGALDCGLIDPSARWLQMQTLTPANFTGDIVQNFTCLTGGLGQTGCGYQQPLQALSVAASATGPASLAEFARPNATLGIVLISDQDDCSTFPNMGMLGPAIPTETDTLRCATRGHTCASANLPYPTSEGVELPLPDCTARTDACPAGTDTSQPTTCTPLASVHAMTEQVKALKPGHADDIVVSALFGWPRTAEEAAKATYKIAPIPNPKYTGDPSTPALVQDLWPVCYDPDHPPTNPDPVTGFDAEAAKYGSKPGLRLSTFVDEFGDLGVKTSLCESDWTPAMQLFSLRGSANKCIEQTLVDMDPSTYALDPDCIVEYLVPTVEPTSSPPPGCGAATDGEQWSRSYPPRCDPSAPMPPCWEITKNYDKCPISTSRLFRLRTPTPYTPRGAHYRLQCRFCPALDSDQATPAGC